MKLTMIPVMMGTLNKVRKLTLIPNDAANTTPIPKLRIPLHDWTAYRWTSSTFTDNYEHQAHLQIIHFLCQLGTIHLTLTVIYICTFTVKILHDWFEERSEEHVLVILYSKSSERKRKFYLAKNLLLGLWFFCIVTLFSEHFKERFNINPHRNAILIHYKSVFISLKYRFLGLFIHPARIFCTVFNLCLFFFK